MRCKIVCFGLLTDEKCGSYVPKLIIAAMVIEKCCRFACFLADRALFSIDVDAFFDVSL